MVVTFYLNNVQVSYSVKPGEYLADTLRNHGLKSIKIGCDESSCGSCTLLVDDKPMMSCSLLTASVEGKHITTIEGIQEEAAKISKHFSDEGADQCGYCTAALALVVHALKKENPHPTREEIEDYFVGNLCRCTGYQSQANAVEKYLGGKK